MRETADSQNYQEYLFTCASTINSACGKRGGYVTIHVSNTRDAVAFLGSGLETPAGGHVACRIRIGDPAADDEVPTLQDLIKSIETPHWRLKGLGIET